MRILLIESDEVMAGQIHAGLQKESFTLDVTADGESGLQMARQGSYDLLILGLRLSRRTGLSVCEALRAQRNTAPILLLAERDDEEEGVRGLEIGADAYLLKPIDLQELLARVRALRRRERIRWIHVMRIADLEIDTSALMVRRAGRDISLTPREFALLQALATHQGRTLTREIILHRVWGNDSRYSNTVNFHIASLRKKIDAGHPLKLIHTVRGLGYTLRGPDGESKR
jgi:two-component system, OmpR family, copper resistance phosphate regulon response regulator CusR